MTEFCFNGHTETRRFEGFIYGNNIRPFANSVARTDPVQILEHKQSIIPTSSVSLHIPYFDDGDAPRLVGRAPRSLQPFSASLKLGHEQDGQGCASSGGEDLLEECPFARIPFAGTRPHRDGAAVPDAT